MKRSAYLPFVVLLAGFFGTTAVTSSNADAAGHGLFEYAVPTGYYTLNTKNLNTYG